MARARQPADEKLISRGSEEEISGKFSETTQEMANINSSTSTFFVHESNYPLVICHIAFENHHAINSGEIIFESLSRYFPHGNDVLKHETMAM